MKSIKNKYIFSAFILISLMMVAVSVQAEPVKFKQVVQIVTAKPGKANTSNFSKLVISKGDPIANDNDGDNDPEKKKAKKDGDGDGDKKADSDNAETSAQDDRVITEITTEIALDEECECTEAIEVVKPGGFPKWALLGLGAVPLPFIKFDSSPTPEGTITPTPTATSPTPTDTPIPEPMTLLLFGTGLSGVGFAARKKFGKKSKGESSE